MDLEEARRLIQAKLARAEELRADVAGKLTELRLLYAEAERLAEENGLVFPFQLRGYEDLRDFVGTNPALAPDWEESEAWQPSMIC